MMFICGVISGMQTNFGLESNGKVINFVLGFLVMSIHFQTVLEVIFGRQLKL